MRTRIPKSKKHLFQKDRTKYYADYRIALQLYNFNKTETVVKKEPRLPFNDRRRAVPQPKHNLSVLQYLRQQILLYIHSRKASGSLPHHTVSSLLKN